MIITSAKKTFFAGGDLNELIKVGRPEAKAFYDMVLALKGQLRALETLGKPVVAAINARPWAAAGKSAWPAIIALPWTINRYRSACRKSPWACCPAAAG